MSGLTTNIARAVVASSLRELDGKTVTRPVLRVADQAGRMTYCVDVDIGQKRVDPNSGDEVAAILQNVPIANGDQSVLYADVGAAVRLRKSDSGTWEVSGYSKRAPGTYVRMDVLVGSLGADPVSVDEGTPVDISLTTRLLTYDELATYGGYGVIPYNAFGVFRGGELIEVHT